MSVAGIKRVARRDRFEFNLLFVLEHYFLDSAFIQRRKEAVRSRVAAALRASGPGRVLQVERRADLSVEEFQREYLRKGVPVVIAGGSEAWPLSKNWTFDAFERRFGGETIRLIQGEGLTEEDYMSKHETSVEIRFDAFLDQLRRGGRKYLRFSPLLERFPELLEDLNHDYFEAMSGSRWGQIYLLFMGAAGTFTRLHTSMSPFFFVNVCGVKRWTLVPNEYLAVLDPAADGRGYHHSDAKIESMDPRRFPGIESIDWLEAVQQPGDILYCPSWMWHSVRNEAPTIGVRCGFVSARNILRESFTLFFTRVFGARNPTMLESLYYMLVRRDLPSRDRRMLIPGLIRKPRRPSPG